MKRFFTTVMLASIALVGCQKAPTTQTQEATETQASEAMSQEFVKIQANGPITTPAGAQFQVFKGWKMQTLSDGIKFKSPEGSVRVDYYELSANEFKSHKDALKETYRRYAPVSDMDEVLPEYWENAGEFSEVSQVQYINMESNQVAINVARKHGDTWYCLIMGGRKDAFQNRAIQAQTMFDTFKLPNHVAKEKADDAFAASLKVKPFDAEAATAFNTFMTENMKKFDVPGAAVVIVQDGKVVHAKGYGTRVYGQDLPVTEKTLFQIGSSAKILTSYLAAEAVRQGKLSWNSPMHQILPGFATADPEITKQITLKHVLSMTSGLPRRDFTMPFRMDNAEQMLKQMGKIKPWVAPGTTWTYNNHNVASAGYAAAHAFFPNDSLDDAWKKAMQAVVFEPLGMTASTYDIEKAQAAEHAAPTAFDPALNHFTVPTSVNKYLSEGYAPAGGLWTNAEDFGKFMIAELNQTDPAHAERWKPIVNVGKEYYGMGLHIYKLDGINFRQHSGALSGYQAYVSFLPDQKMAIAIMTNDSIASIHRPAFQKVLDLTLGFKSADINITAMEQAINEIRQKGEEEMKQINLTPDAEWLESLVGKYKGKDIPEAEIAIVNGKGIFKTPYWESEFGSVKKDGKTMLILTQEPAQNREFQIIKEKGKVSALVLIEDQEIVKYEYILNKI